MHGIEHQFFKGPKRIGHYNENSHQIIQDRFITLKTPKAQYSPFPFSQFPINQIEKIVE